MLATATTPATDMPEPTAVLESKSATIPAPDRMPEREIVLEPKPEETSDQVCELATSSVPEGILVEGMEWSPTLSTAAEEELLIDFECEFATPVSPCTEPVLSPSSTMLLMSVFSPCLPLPPPLNVSSLPYKNCVPVLCWSRVSFMRDLSVLCLPKEIIVKFLSALPSLPALLCNPL